MKMKSKFGKGPGRGNIGPRGPRSSPPGYSRSPGPPMQRKMIPQTIPHRNAPPRNFGRPRPRAPRELDNVLKKLKDMSK